jgi:hypothetical protein
MTIFKEFGYTGKWAKYRDYHPNFMVIGLSFTIVQTYYGTALCIGAIPAYFWNKRNPKSFDIYGKPLHPNLYLNYIIANKYTRLRRCRWSHRWRGYWWCYQRRLPNRRHLRSGEVRLVCWLPSKLVLSDFGRTIPIL